MDSTGYGNGINGDIQLPNEIINEINDCFSNLLRITKVFEPNIEDLLVLIDRLRRKENKGFDVEGNMKIYKEKSSSIVSEECCNCIKSISEKWRRFVETELDNIESGREEFVDFENIRILANMSLSDLKDDLITAKNELLTMLQRIEASDLLGKLNEGIEELISDIEKTLTAEKLIEYFLEELNRLKENIKSGVGEFSKDSEPHRNSFAKTLDVTNVLTFPIQKENAIRFTEEAAGETRNRAVDTEKYAETGNSDNGTSQGGISLPII